MANANVTKDTDHIEKFNGTNFPSWKYGIWMYLEKKGYTQLVEGIETEPRQVRHTPIQIITYSFSIPLKSDASMNLILSYLQDTCYLTTVILAKGSVII